MSYRDFWDEESFQQYKADLIRERNELNPVTNQLHIKILDGMIEKLPERYSDFFDDEEDTTDEQVCVDDSPKEPKTTLKEKILSTLGIFGYVLVFIIRSIISVLPFVMIGGNFFVTFLLIGVSYFLPLSTIIFWIWGLICAITGVQDIWAIIYYIAFIVIWIPFFISTIVSIFSKK